VPARALPPIVDAPLSDTDATHNCPVMTTVSLRGAHPPIEAVMAALVLVETAIVVTLKFAEV
jgi:hypothetical protein